MSKTFVEKYVLRYPNGRWLANVVLDDQGGDIYVQSDYGIYAYTWLSSGRGKQTLKQFLLTANDSYVMDKFGYGGKNDYFYGDRTIDRIKKDLFQMRREDRIEKEMARECFEELENLEGNCISTAQEMYDLMTDIAPKTLEVLYDNAPWDIPWVNDTHPQLVAFMDNVWPVFMTELRKEL